MAPGRPDRPSPSGATDAARPAAADVTPPSGVDGTGLPVDAALPALYQRSDFAPGPPLPPGRGGDQRIPRPRSCRAGGPAPWAAIPEAERVITVDDVRRALATSGPPLLSHLEGTGVRASIVHPGPTKTSMGWSLPAEKIGPALEDWARWGQARHDYFLRAADLARAITFVAETPRGGFIANMELQPDAP